MLRHFLVVVACLVTLSPLSSLGCKNTGDGATGEGGAPKPKLYCKMNSQCWICPDDEAMKKCIINPGTSGCKLGGPTDCP